MNYEEITVKSRDGYELDVRVYDTPSPRAAVKFIHGMEEHQDRYVPFASFLRDSGYAVITSDMRGHGKKAPLLSHIADRDGDRLLIEDEEAVLSLIRGRYPDVPVFLFAHSMGTIIARRLLQTRSGDFSKAALSGYPNPNPAAGAGIALCGIAGTFRGRKGHSALLDSMVLGGFSKAVPNAETPLDWLSFDRDNVRRYSEDPLCGVPFTIGSYDALMRLIRDIGNPALYRDVNTALPILLISGIDDPCTGGEKGRQASLDVLRRAGFACIDTVTLDGMRHEILNESAKDQVFSRILSFFEA